MKRFMCLHNFTFGTTSLVLFTLSLTVSSAVAEIHQNTLTVDATSRDNWAYVNLVEGAVVEIKDAETSTEWHLGFKRTEAIVNGGISGPGKAGALALKGVPFEEVVEAPEGDYVSDTDQIATLARGDGWYTYTGPPKHWVLPNAKVYFLQIAADASAQLASPYYYAKLRFTGYYENNETKEGAANISIEYVLQDDGTRNFVDVESEPTSVDARQKVTTTWAVLKQTQ